MSGGLPGTLVRLREQQGVPKPETALGTPFSVEMQAAQGEKKMKRTLFVRKLTAEEQNFCDIMRVFHEVFEFRQYCSDERARRRGS